jgi:hypothetical protein
MDGIFDRAYAAKAWAAALVAAVSNVATLVQVAAADEAISLTEAKGIWLSVTAAASVLAGGWAVFKARNAPAPSP